jgi:hypothetical protein
MMSKAELKNDNEKPKEPTIQEFLGQIVINLNNNMKKIGDQIKMLNAQFKYLKWEKEKYLEIIRKLK